METGIKVVIVSRIGSEKAETVKFCLLPEVAPEVVPRPMAAHADAAHSHPAHT